MSIVPPFSDKFLIPGGEISKTWHRWIQFVSREFGDMSTKVDKVPTATVGNIATFTASGNVADGGTSLPSGTLVTTTAAQALTNKTYDGIAAANLLSRIVNEEITGVWHFKKHPSVTYTTSTTITTSLFGKIIKFDNGINDVICYLPSVNVTDVDGWYTIMRLGTGQLTIVAADSDTIESSIAGGKIICAELGRVVANATLLLAADTKWAITAATGIWNVV